MIPANCEVQGQEQIKYIHIRSSFNVLILDGSIEYDAHVLSEICKLTCFKALVTSTEGVTPKLCFSFS